MTRNALTLSLFTVLAVLSLVPHVHAGPADGPVAVLAARISGASELAISQLNTYIAGDAVDFLGGRAQKDAVCKLGDAYLAAVEGFIQEARPSVPEKVLAPLVEKVKSTRHSLSYLRLLDDTPDDIYKIIVDHQKAMGEIEKCAASLVP